jgi:hypothetical protein
MHIELLKPHTHAERRYGPGEILELRDAAAQWLIERGVAKPADGSAPSQPKPRKGD